MSRTSTTKKKRVSHDVLERGSAAAANRENNKQDSMFKDMGPFLKRALNVSQMDVGRALDEMVSLMTQHPARVFKQAYYRKQTKDRWSRDDPAFAVCQTGFLAVAITATAMALRARRVLTYTYLIFAAVVVHWLLGGLIASVLATFLANRYLRKDTTEAVEWFYAFDVHCNAFFCYFLLTYVVHFFLLPLTLHHTILALLLGNTLHAVAVSLYFYITHIGFRTLPFLHNTEVFLYPAALTILLWGLGILLAFFGLRFNFATAAIAALLAPLPY